MKGFIGNIEQLTVDNTDYRKALYTGKHLQLVVMCLQPGEEIGEESHDGHDQFIRIEQGSALCTIGTTDHHLKDDDSVIIPSGALHNVKNIGNGPLKLYTLYSPPEHMHNTRHITKADERHEHFDGTTSE